MRRGDDLHGRYSMMQQDFICPTGDSGGDDLARGLNCPLPRPKQRTRTNRGSQLLEPGDGPQVEAYEYDALRFWFRSDFNSTYTIKSLFA